MNEMNISRARRDGARAESEKLTGGTPPPSSPSPWFLAAAVVIALALAAILLIDIDSQPPGVNDDSLAAEAGTGEMRAGAAEDDGGRARSAAESTVPPLEFRGDEWPEAPGSIPPQNASSERIAAFEESLARRITARRADAERGDLLDEELVRYLQRVTGELLEGEGGDDVLATLRESNPGYELEEDEVRPELAVNAPYPEESPLSTVPPSLLKVYPPLPEDIEYRFVGCRLVLLNVDARLILDYTEQCLW